jgi:DNA-binding NarL/FixJ family response regulator
VLTLGTLAVQWLDFDRTVLMRSGDVDLYPVALGALAAGIYIGTRVLGAKRPPTGDGNHRARAALGISPSEHTVLAEFAAGRSNKEIALRVGISPNTVKTHVSRIYNKLGARRRTDAVNRARELGIVP